MEHLVKVYFFYFRHFYIPVLDLNVYFCNMKVLEFTRSWELLNLILMYTFYYSTFVQDLDLYPWKKILNITFYNCCIITYTHFYPIQLWLWLSFYFIWTTIHFYLFFQNKIVKNIFNTNCVVLNQAVVLSRWKSVQI